MVFSSFVFLLLFLPAVFILNYLVSMFRKEYSNTLLLIASLVFYAWGEPVYVLLLMASIVISWIMGLAVGRTEGPLKKAVLAAAVIVDLGILGYYKYAGFLAETANRLLGREIVPVLSTALPIGISFFTFQAISYVIDVYRGETEASKKITDVALYISFFPKLTVGPIVKYKDIHQQIENREINWQSVSEGFRRFIYGLGKKVLISNVLGLCVDRIYSFEISAVDTKAAWIAAAAYMLQIYYDFSGYSDMAIGLGRMFGFRITENFDYPYLSKSITEFWRRWHITLGSWFRDYLYIPLGGNRKGPARTYLNLGIVFFMTGLWHGAGFAFILWGLYHGFFSIAERLGLKKILDRAGILSIIYTNVIVGLGWVLFRAGTTLTGLRMLARMVCPGRYAGISLPAWRYMDTKTVFMMIAGLIGMGVLQAACPEKLKEKWKGSVIEALYLVALLLLCMASIASDTYQPFIYFQF